VPMRGAAHQEFFPDPVILVMAIMILAWELVGGPLLAHPRFQPYVLAFSWSMHAALALIGFVDFGALALALLLTFVPRPYLDLIGDRVRLGPLGIAPPRPHLYFGVALFAGIASGLGQRLAAGLLFNLAALVLLWPALSALAQPSARPPWPGVPVALRLAPRWMLVFPAVLLLHGFTSYLGLRTTGNFSMFSNLRTEGPVSNHLLLGSNPLKLWSYQEDVVRFHEVDDERARIGHQYQPLEGHLLPVVEFRKLIRLWSEAGVRVPMTLEYRGTIHSTEDIANDPAWRTVGRDWEMILLDFRTIQPDGPNRCRW
jgi:hypothetical protein